LTIAAVLVVVVLVSCRNGEDRAGKDVRTGPDPTPEAAGAPDASGVEDLLVGCGRYGYAASALSGPTGEESADDPAAAELREVIDGTVGVESVPKTGWRRLYNGNDAVVFGATDADSPAAGLFEVTVERSGDGFDYASSAHGCVPRVVVEGRSLVEFALAPEAELTASSTVVEVLVTELACTGSAPVDDRLDRPTIIYGETSVDVLFTADPLEGDSFFCPGHLPTAVTITLEEPLGDRVLRDSSTYPPRDASGPL
jgi:hypothetical protein